MKPLGFLFLYARNYRLTLFITVLSMLLLVGAQLAIPWIVRTMIDAVTDSADGMSYSLVTQLALMALAIYIARGLLQFLRSYMAHIAGWGVVAEARKKVYEHLQKLSLRFYEDKQTGQLMSRVVNDSDKFELLIAHAIPDIIVNVLTLIGVMIVLMMMNTQLALLSMAPIPLVIIALRLFAIYVRPAFRKRQHELGELNAILNDNLSGIREIKAFTREKTELNRIWVRIDHYRDSLLRALKLMAIFDPFIQFTSALGTIVVIYFGGMMILNGTLGIADLVAFFLYLELFYQPLHHLSTAWENIQESLASAERVAELLDEEPEVELAVAPVVMPPVTKGELKFENAGFAYLPGHPVLQGIDLHMPAQSTVALVGPTGVGKTTLASLVPRFYDVTEGSVYLDGQDLSKIPLDSLRKQISMVLQDVFLFHGTVRSNILFGREEATEDEVIAAAKTANAHEFISELPDGYDTLIGERGVKLSGGQKQRLSIARAILKDAPILILDEATSAVDAETETLIQEALERLMVGRTTMIIAHRLSTIRNADQIVVLEEGRIAELGSHDDLYAKKGAYWRLCQIQQSAGLSAMRVNGPAYSTN